MDNMFYGAVNFNQTINSWNVKNVKNMKYMFAGTNLYNEPLTNWNTSNVINMSYMFHSAIAYNQPTIFNTENVTNMDYMFYGTKKFNEDISLNYSNINTMFKFLENSSLNEVKMSKILNLLNNNDKIINKTIGNIPNFLNNSQTSTIYTSLKNKLNDISGLPIIEALSDWTVNMYNFPTKVFQKTGSAIIISGSMNISGSLTMAPSSSFVLPLTSSTSPTIGSAYWSGSFLFIYNGTKYVSASFA
jgi:surface protein